MAAKEIIQADTVLQSVGHVSVHPTFVQRAGIQLAGGVGLIIAIVTVTLVGFFCWHYPPMPQLNASDDSAKLIEQYKQLAEVATTSGQTIFQTIVTQALLPVFTAILGYIFAKSGKE